MWTSISVNAYLQVMSAWIQEVIEKKDEHRALVADLLLVLHKAGLAPTEQLGQAFTPHLETLSVRFLYDVPRLSSHKRTRDPKSPPPPPSCLITPTGYAD